jgi:hypothetical protein
MLTATTAFGTIASARDTVIRHQTASGRDIDRGFAENIRETPDKARLEQLLITP